MLSTSDLRVTCSLEVTFKSTEPNTEFRKKGDEIRESSEVSIRKDYLMKRR